MRAYTEGPWEVRVGGNFVDIWVANHSYSKDSLPSAYKVGESNYRQSDDGSSTREQAIANATIMAAAPEMAEMLLAMYDLKQRHPKRPEVEVLLKKAGVL